MRILLILLVLSAPALAQKCVSIDGLPDPVCSPGVARTQDLDIICKQGAQQFRPNLYQALKLKRQVMEEYGITNWRPWILDHIIAIQDGGDGFDIRNMFLQPRRGKWNSKLKDKAERIIHKRICSGQVTAAEGQRQLATNWKLIK